MATSSRRLAQSSQSQTSAGFPSSGPARPGSSGRERSATSALTQDTREIIGEAVLAGFSPPPLAEIGTPLSPPVGPHCYTSP